MEENRDKLVEIEKKIEKISGNWKKIEKLKKTEKNY